MISPPPPRARRRLRKPTSTTRFHIDFTWWERSEEDLSIYLRRLLPAGLRAALPADQSDNGAEQDWVHPRTGRVLRLNALQRALQDASQRTDFINPEASLVDVLFRILLTNDNNPLSVEEFAAQSGRPAPLILKTIGGRRVYKGIRPVD